MHCSREDKLPGSLDDNLPRSTDDSSPRSREDSLPRSRDDSFPASQRIVCPAPERISYPAPEMTLYPDSKRIVYPFWIHPIDTPLYIVVYTRTLKVSVRAEKLQGWTGKPSTNGPNVAVGFRYRCAPVAVLRPPNPALLLTNR